jgi:putative transcriptional regulator
MKTNNLFENISKGLNEAILHEKGKKLAHLTVHKVSIAPLKQYPPKKIRLIRMNLGMSQPIFANVLGVSQKTVEAWEAGRNEPNGTAQRFLSILEKDNKFLEKYKILSVK